MQEHCSLIFQHTFNTHTHILRKLLWEKRMKTYIKSQKQEKPLSKNECIRIIGFAFASYYNRWDKTSKLPEFCCLLRMTSEIERTKSEYSMTTIWLHCRKEAALGQYQHRLHQRACFFSLVVVLFEANWEASLRCTHFHYFTPISRHIQTVCKKERVSSFSLLL